METGADVEERTTKKACLGEEMDEDHDDSNGVSAEELWKLLREKEQQLREKEQQLTEKEQQSREKEQQLTEENQRLSKQNKILDEDFSVMKLLVSMPRMQVNRANHPSIIKNEVAHQLVTSYREKLSKYHEDLVAWNSGKSSMRPKPLKRLNFHEPAEIEVIELSPELLDGFEIHFKDGAGKLIKSQLALKASMFPCFDKDGRRMMSHDNETSPQDYLAFAIEDAIKCCGFGGQLRVVKEATLFSLRPDLVVVVVDGCLLFVAEVKNPSGPDFLSVFESETAGGQTLDYLKALKQQGIDWPFALLSTYNESIIARLPDDNQKYKEIFQGGSKNAQKCPLNRHTKRKSESHGKGPSPSKPAFCMKLPSIPAQSSSEAPPLLEVDDRKDLAMVRSARSKSNPGSSYDYKGRKVIYSQVFNVDCLFKVLILALESSMESRTQSMQCRRPLLPKEGESLLDTELCTLYEEGFSYEKVSIKSFTYSKEPQVKQMKKYHAICQVGQGGSGKTILCSSSSGKLFAVKLFLISASTLYSEEDRQKDFQNNFKIKKEEAEEECKRWRHFEPRYRGFCHVVTLNGMPAMTMPYFPPVPYEQRKTALGPIKQRLEYLADQGFYYSNDDLRWRHFGCRWTGEQMAITLLDLGSLVKKKSNIDKQVRELQDRMTLDEYEEAKPVLAK